MFGRLDKSPTCLRALDGVCGGGHGLGARGGQLATRPSAAPTQEIHRTPTQHRHEPGALPIRLVRRVGGGRLPHVLLEILEIAVALKRRPRQGAHKSRVNEEVFAETDDVVGHGSTLRDATGSLSGPGDVANRAGGDTAHNSAET